MAIEDDWAVDRATGNVRAVAGIDNYRVVELHRYLQTLGGSLTSTGDDEQDITDANPSRRVTDNIIELLGAFNIDDASARRLYDGSIIQAGGGTIYDGFTNFGNQGVYIDVIQDGAILSPNFWGAGINANPAQNISHQFLVKVRDGGADIDGRRVIGITREFGQTYGEFSVNGTSRGNNVLALSNSDDAFNNTAEGTVATNLANFTLATGVQLIDVDNNGADEEYAGRWDVSGANGAADLYEATKYIGRRGSAETILGLNGNLFRGITHSIDYDGEASGPFTVPELLTFGNGATAQLLALQDGGATGTLHVQLLTGVAPADDDTISGGTSGASALVNAAPTARTVSPEFLGAFTGSLTGAFGVGVNLSELGQADRLTSLDGVTRQPPNIVTFSVQDVEAGDVVFVAPRDGGGNIDEGQLQVSGALSGAAVTSVTMSAAIPLDTPSSGFIRVIDDAGKKLRVAYSSYSGSTFTIPAFDFSGANQVSSGNNAYITYIDRVATGTTESFTSVYQAERPRIVRVKNAAALIIPFEAVATLGSAGGGVNARRDSDA